MSVFWMVHHFGIGWTVLTVFTDIRGPLKLNPNNFGVCSFCGKVASTLFMFRAGSDIWAQR